MSTRAFVICEVRLQDAAQPRFLEHDQVVKTFSSTRSNKPCDIGILPRRSRSCADAVNAYPLGRLIELVTVASVTIMEQIARGTVPGEGLQELLSRPCRSGMLGHSKMHEVSAIM